MTKQKTIRDLENIKDWFEDDSAFNTAFENAFEDIAEKELQSLVDALQELNPETRAQVIYCSTYIPADVPLLKKAVALALDEKLNYEIQVEIEAEENALIDRYFKEGKPADLAKKIDDEYGTDVTDKEVEEDWCLRHINEMIMTDR